MARFYEDLVLGEVVRSLAVALSEREIVEFANKYDPQYFHTDPVAARRSPFGGVIASGTHSIAHWCSLNDIICKDIQWICGLGIDHLRFLKGLRPDVLVYATAECTKKRLSQSDPKRGVVTYHYKLTEEDGDTIISFLSTNLVNTRNSQIPAA